MDEEAEQLEEQTRQLQELGEQASNSYADWTQDEEEPESAPETEESEAAPEPDGTSPVDEARQNEENVAQFPTLDTSSGPTEEVLEALADEFSVDPKSALRKMFGMVEQRVVARFQANNAGDAQVNHLLGGANPAFYQKYGTKIRHTIAQSPANVAGSKEVAIAALQMAIHDDLVNAEDPIEAMARIVELARGKKPVAGQAARRPAAPTISPTQRTPRPVAAGGGGAAPGVSRNTVKVPSGYEGWGLTDEEARDLARMERTGRVA